MCNYYEEEENLLKSPLFSCYPKGDFPGRVLGGINVSSLSVTCLNIKEYEPCIQKLVFYSFYFYFHIINR